MIKWDSPTPFSGAITSKDHPVSALAKTSYIMLYSHGTFSFSLKYHRDDSFASEIEMKRLKHMQYIRGKLDYQGTEKLNSS